jgi:hypothetical protein
MNEPGGGETAVALPAIAVDERAGGDGAADDVGEDRARAIVDAGEPDPAAGAARPRFDGDGGDRPAGRRAPSQRPRRGRADRRLIDFQLAGEPVTTWSHDCSAQLVQQRPCPLVASQAEQPLQPSALTPCFVPVTYQAAANQLVSGRRLAAKIVPAVTE